MITIAIRTDNAAFGEDASDTITRSQEVARILRKLADDLDGQRGMPENLRDINGNRVGNVVCTGADRNP